MRFLPKMKQAFTLIELLVVIGVLTVLLAIVLVAINPTRQFQQANDTQRRSDVNAILNAVHQYGVDNKGSLPAAITATATVIGNGVGQIDICSDLVTAYLADLPLDPTTGTTDSTSNCTAATAYSTGYKISKSASDSRVTVTATAEVSGVTISVTR